jgi:hypothetical protein
MPMDSTNIVGTTGIRRIYALHSKSPDLHNDLMTMLSHLQIQYFRPLTGYTGLTNTTGLPNNSISMPATQPSGSARACGLRARSRNASLTALQTYRNHTKTTMFTCVTLRTGSGAFTLNTACRPPSVVRVDQAVAPVSQPTS